MMETRHLPMHTLGILLFKHFTEALRSHRYTLCRQQLDWYRRTRNRYSDIQEEKTLLIRIFAAVIVVVFTHSFESHIPHMGLTGRQTFCPYMTKVLFTLVHSRLLTILFSSLSVCLTVLVSISPSLFEILWTCISTGIAGLLKA